MKKVVFALLAAVAVGVFGVSTAYATGNMQSAENVTVSQNEVVDATLYAAGDTVVVEGTVNGDVYCAGQSVEVNGTVNGDVICAGQEVRVDGVVNGDVRLAGQNVFVGAEVERSATVMGQSVTLMEDARIGQDITAMGQNVRLDGTIERDSVIGGDRVTFAGMVGRDATVDAVTTTLRNGSHVGGDIVYTSNNEADISSGATVSGDITRQEPPKQPAQAETEEVPLVAWVTGAVFGIASLLLIGVVMLALAPRKVDDISNYVQKKSYIAVGVGLLGVIVTPIVAGLVMITVIGIPLALIALALWMIGLTVGFILAAQAFGDWIFRLFKWQFEGKAFVSLLVGLVLLVLITSIPFIGWLIGLLAVACGFGGKVVVLSRDIADQHKKKTRKS